MASVPLSPARGRRLGYNNAEISRIGNVHIELFERLFKWNGLQHSLFAFTHCAFPSIFDASPVATWTRDDFLHLKFSSWLRHRLLLFCNVAGHSPLSYYESSAM